MTRRKPLLLSGWRSTGRFTVAAGCVLFLTGVAGCGGGVLPQPAAPIGGGVDDPLGGGVDDPPVVGDVIDGNRDGSVTSPYGKTSGEPNETFSQAIAAVFDTDGVARLQGMISARGDLDVYYLGALSAGDWITVDAATTGSALDVSIALFDGDQRLVYHNDDRGGLVDRFLDSFIEWIVRHDSNAYYLVVTNAAFASPGTTSGSYRIDVETEGGLAVPSAVGQIVLLDFDGGEVDSPALGTFAVDPFDAGAITPAYQGQTDALKAAIRASIEQNFERFNVTVLTTDDPPPASGVKFSTVYFGGFNPTAFGIAEAVDVYNFDYCDDAIIYTESFTPSVFSQLPTVVEMGVAIGNVASHEAAHLLGLNHVDDDLALMDDRSAADVFLTDQEFKEAPLSSDIMSIGTQDAVLLLEETVGSR